MRALLLLALSGLLAVPGSMGLVRADTVDRVELEAQLDDMRAQIELIRQRLGASLGERDIVLDQLAESERTVSAAERARRQTLDSIEEQRAELARLAAEQAELNDRMEENTLILSGQLALAYRQGNASRLRLILGQDDPRPLNRSLAYHGYLTRSRLASIRALAVTVEALDVNRQAALERQAELERLAERQQQLIDSLQLARNEREQALERLEQRILTRQEELAGLESAAAELAALIDELAQALADIPPEIEVTPIAEMRGQLPQPVRSSTVQRRFGDHRAGDLVWNGWLFEAAAGSEVMAVAYGRVAYADWLRGYGLILIIEHGDGFMSLYAHNEALLRDVGDWVRPGEVIATVGDSGAAGQTGLYFELRRNGQPINPAGWLQR
ncbi:MAG: hypothetical protein EA370_08125 [Wenzhouxiangella sp.]|nr:MAG: hypothetical protein EA370_08125 [Wenzhouxiangella sp.]